MGSLLKKFEEDKFIALIKCSVAEDAEEMLKAALAGDIRIIEISMQIPQATRLIETYSKRAGILIGAGNISDGEMAQRAINAGAKYISSQFTDREIISVAHNNESFVIQGAFTPNEAINAHHWGADLIQIYPVSHAGGVEYMKSLKSSFSFLKLVAAGDIHLDNAFEYLKYASAVYVDKALFDRPLLRADNWSEMTERAKQLTQKLEASRVAKQSLS